MQALLLDALPDLIATLAGVAIGGVGALLAGRAADRRRRRQRARVVLRNLRQEMIDDYQILKTVRASVHPTQPNVHFYLSTTAWDTAIAGGDLPEIIGYRLAIAIEKHYAMIVQLRHYVAQLAVADLQPAQTERASVLSLRERYRQIVIKGIEGTLRNHPQAISEIEQALQQMPAAARQASAGSEGIP